MDDCDVNRSITISDDSTVVVVDDERFNDDVLEISVPLKFGDEESSSSSWSPFASASASSLSMPIQAPRSILTMSRRKKRHHAAANRRQHNNEDGFPVECCHSCPYSYRRELLTDDMQQLEVNMINYSRTTSQRSPPTTTVKQTKKKRSSFALLCASSDLQAAINDLQATI